MDPKDVAEEHRKYLDMKDNPQRVSTTAIFKLLSDNMVSIQTRLSVIETKQNNTHEYLDDVAKKLDHVEEKMNNKIDVLEDDFKSCQMTGFGARSVNEERFRWLGRMNKLILLLVTTSISLILYLHFGISIP